jgi:hypothetical protein
MAACAAKMPAPDAAPAPAPPPPVPPLPDVMPAPVTPIISAVAPSPDPRVGLKAGYWDAAQAAWNMRLVSNTPPPAVYRGITSSDLAFTGTHVVQGNYNGILFWDISNPAKPVLVKSYQCPASQNDVSVYKHLLFVSSEGTNARLDCGTQGVPAPISKERIRGRRILGSGQSADAGVGRQRPGRRAAAENGRQPRRFGSGAGSPGPPSAVRTTATTCAAVNGFLSSWPSTAFRSTAPSPSSAYPDI